MARFLVTGGSGFIGTHLVSELLAQGEEVVNMDVAAPKIPEQVPFWRKVDLLDAGGIKGLFEDFRPDVVINLAAIADISMSLKDMMANVTGLSNLLEATADWPHKPRLIHTSTQLVVGPGIPVGDPQDLHPYTEYGESKALSEKVLWDWPGDIEWTIIRPCLVWGSHYPHFARATWYYLQRRWYLVPSRNSAVKTFSYVSNLVDQYLAAARLPASDVDRKVFYGGDCNLDSAEWLDAFAREMTGKPARRMPYGALEFLAKGGDLLAKLGLPSPLNSGRLFRMTQDYPNPIAETHRVLGAPKHSMAEGIKATVAWLREAYPDRFA